MKFVFCEGDDDVAVVKGLVKHLKLEITVSLYLRLIPGKTP
jgi:hypothetical protein